MWRPAFFLILFLLPTLPAQAGWEELKPGLWYQQKTHTSPDALSSTPMIAHLFRVDLAKWKLGLLHAPTWDKPALTAEAYAHQSKASLVINGGYFDEAQHSLGLLLSDGVVINPVRPVSWSIFLIEKNQAKIIARTEKFNAKKIQTALQCGPRLVVDGKVNSLKESLPSFRSAVGIDANGQVILAVSDGVMSLPHWAELLKTETLHALNLDGGSSSQLKAKIGNFKLALRGQLPVPNALGLFPK